MLAAALQSVDLVSPDGEMMPELVGVRAADEVTRPDEGAIIRDVAAAFPEVTYVFFRRFDDGRASRPAAFVVDNSDERWTANHLAQLHRRLWLHGAAPLVYAAWPTQIDILTCARGPDFWKNGHDVYRPVERIQTAALIEAELRKRRRFSARRLADGTFWDEPENSPLARHEQAAHQSLIQAIVDVDSAIEGEASPVTRSLLLLTVLIKYLEDRRVFPSGWFGRFQPGARTFFQVLQHGDPERVSALLQALERRFNGDVFCLPVGAREKLTRRRLLDFAQLVEARTSERQRYLWEQYSFEHLPVEIISHLYQRFLHGPGMVYTPPMLASLLLDHAMPYDKLTGTERILDPSCGSGVFLVGAFRRLVNLWRSRNQWQQPDVETLQRILGRSIFGIELDEGALDLAAFSLSLAVCDALKPNVIWRELRFEKLRGTNLMKDDLFKYVQDPGNGATPARLGQFDVIIGNPPFVSKLTEAGRHLNERAERERGRLPDQQSAYLFLEQTLRMLAPGGRLCLIQPSSFLYNRKASHFRRHIFRNARISTIFDFTSIRRLYDGADPKTIAVLAELGEPVQEHQITHLTFRRTFATCERIGFEIDHYDRHRVPQLVAESDPLAWRANLLGGGRLPELATRLRSIRTVQEFVEQQGWISGEGFTVGNRAKAAPSLSGKPLLPTEALGSKGIDKSRIGIVDEDHFEAPRKDELFQGPLILIREHESLPMDFWEEGWLAYKHKIVGIRSPAAERDALRRFFHTLRRRVRQYQFCVALNGSQALVGKATAILKADIEALPYPEDATELDFVFWETALQDDVLDYMVPYVRLGQNSELLQRAAGPDDMRVYVEMFCRLLGTVYDNLRAAAPRNLGGLICQPFYFGDTPRVEWLDEDGAEELQQLVYHQAFESLRTVRVVRLYQENVLFIVKPDRLRYWIRSTAIRDADDTLVDLYRQGY
jgi:methylase of polypeptide subunit release factors